ncbi:AEC family transporter [Fulvimarina sp. 2208YS6-2-32]|uniref:AEC family transporter n=1 Tax=Fulvimarina uroteuthidis TaxID=3098149 RepID=A0ABU5HY39_9HYPH|nr:AEC family transporter [Fulvimarina sp. 2208YS6-2-32]MDY8107688.1 AEC family transporter [Fulvimarina sp. 2208YS6-2-32]
MQTILDIIVPVFGLIAIGFLAGHFRILSEDVGQALAKFVFVVAVPVLLFRSLSQAAFGGSNPLALWAIYFGAVALAWTIGTVLIRRIAKADHRTGVIAGITSSFANTVFVALPTIQRAYGDIGLEPLLLILAIHLPIMMIASTLMVERAVILDARTGDGQSERVDVSATLKRVGRNLATNSIIIGIACGLLWRGTGLELESHFDQITQLIGSTAGPLALFSLGMSLTRYGLKGDLVSASLITFVSLVVQPGLVWLAASQFGLTTLWLNVAVLTAAAPAGVNAYLFAAYFGTGEKLAATTILLSTMLSVVTLSLWLSVLGVG